MTKAGRLFLVRIYDRAHVRMVPNILVIFGDNVRGKGYGGQAGACRDEPNVLGIPVKWKPEKHVAACFTDRDIAEVGPPIEKCFKVAEETLLRGQDVAYPFYGVGSGRALLESFAPKVMALVHIGEQRLRKAARQVIEANNLYLVKAHCLLEEALDGP